MTSWLAEPLTWVLALSGVASARCIYLKKELEKVSLILKSSRELLADTTRQKDALVLQNRRLIETNAELKARPEQEVLTEVVRAVGEALMVYDRSDEVLAKSTIEQLREALTDLSDD